MNGFMEWCIIASAVVGYANFAFLVIIDNKLRELGAQEGDTIHILDFEFDYKE